MSFLSALTLLVHLCGCYLAAEPQNQCTNGGFEQLDADGNLVDWTPVGARPNTKIKSTGLAHSGKLAVEIQRLIPEAKQLSGLNRAYRPRSGEAGAMLQTKKGALSFWYQAVSDENAAFHFYAIPMDKDGIEKTGEPRETYKVPVFHLNDGEWHQGIVLFDWTEKEKVKWVQIAPRIRGGRGTWILDDIHTLKKAGAVPVIDKLTIEEIPTNGPNVFNLSARIKNVGDEISSGSVSLKLPKGLDLLDSPVSRPLPPLKVKEDVDVIWRLKGIRRSGAQISVAVDFGRWKEQGTLRLNQKLKLLFFAPERYIVAPGTPLNVLLWIKNDGNAPSSNVDVLITAEDKDYTYSTKSIAVNETHKVSLKIKNDLKKKYPVLNAVVKCEDQELSTQSSLANIGKFPQMTKGLSAAPNIIQEPGSVRLENSRLRLLFPKTRFGNYGLMRLEGAQKNGARILAAYDCFSRLACKVSDGNSWEQTIFADQIHVQQRPEFAKLIFTSKFSDVEGGTWQAEFEFLLKKKSPAVDVAYRISADRTRQLLRFDGPMIYAGEGSSGMNKSEAVLPGLEWLVADEFSSNSLDIAQGHEHQLRYVPHPNMITVPAMAVCSQGAAVGMLWDVHQKWHGQEDRPSPVFASPDRFNGRNAHLIGLMAPTVPEWVPVNKRAADKPYELKAGQKLELKAQIFVDSDAKDALSVLDYWFQQNKEPEPQPYQQGDLVNEVAFSMQAYLESLWVKEENKWWSTIGGGPLRSKPVLPPHYCFDLAMADVLLPDGELKNKCLAKLQEVRRLGAPVPMSYDQGFTWSDPRTHIQNKINTAARSLSSMSPDGTWGFDALTKRSGIFEGKDYRELGRHGQAELGTIAVRAYNIIKAAMWTGDTRLFKKAEQPLAAMKQFNVPRAAQVWEIPVHTPDVLAASDAVEAYIEAYRFSGKEEYLQEAVRWARRGLPFVFVWNTEDFKFMRYGSIPVFGATWYQGSWFGRVVQWNGLRFAYALLKLSEYDRSRDWRKIADGLTRSAMYQQYQDGEHVALWPDGQSTLTGKKIPWIFSPQWILKMVYAQLGCDPEPSTLILKNQKHRIHVTARAKLSHGAWENDRLRLTCETPERQPTWLLVTPVRSPGQIKVNGAAIRQMEEIRIDRTGWRYDSLNAFLWVRLPVGGKHEIEVARVTVTRPSVLPDLVKRIDFNFENDVEGWRTTNHLEFVGISDGIFRLRATGHDPYMNRSSVRLKPDQHQNIIVRMKVSKGSSVQIFWTTSQHPGYSEKMAVSAPLKPGQDFQVYRFKMNQHHRWKGQTVTGLRLDPTSGVKGAEIEIDWIRGE
ncbi:MAG: hypothetical protein QGF00_04685 [Planctomycetota bacterium]|nr:hypothetical protein [Planctomycetota bacterium]